MWSVESATVTTRPAACASAQRTALAYSDSDQPRPRAVACEAGVVDGRCLSGVSVDDLVGYRVQLGRHGGFPFGVPGQRWVGRGSSGQRLVRRWYRDIPAAPASTATIATTTAHHGVPASRFAASVTAGTGAGAGAHATATAATGVAVA